MGIIINIVPAFGYISPFHCEDTASIGAKSKHLASFKNWKKSISSVKSVAEKQFQQHSKISQIRQFAVKKLTILVPYNLSILEKGYKNSK
ncbi:MAG: hypothetical protein RSF34_01045 [Flavobacterium sp.]|uniref:hypothetical protein n=1 Tax=Flavobacterium sp. TaxID=239 RepID=UPI002FC7A399